MKAVTPINYNLEFEPDLDKFTFAGKAKILLELNGPANKIILNCADLEIKSCLITENKKTIKPTFKLNPDDEKLTIGFKEKIKGKAELVIDFSGKLNDQLVGWYRSKYLHNGKEKYLATTQFEAADARRAFPCFDHPAYKATFDVAIIIQDNLQTVSNMPYSIFPGGLITRTLVLPCCSCKNSSSPTHKYRR